MDKIDDETYFVYPITIRDIVFHREEDKIKLFIESTESTPLITYHFDEWIYIYLVMNNQKKVENFFYYFNNIFGRRYGINLLSIKNHIMTKSDLIYIDSTIFRDAIDNKIDLISDHFLSFLTKKGDIKIDDIIESTNKYLNKKNITSSTHKRDLFY